MKRYMKEHKIVVVAAILLLILIVIAFMINSIFFTNSKNAYYGNRLKGIEEVKITSSQKKDLIDVIKNEGIVSNVKYDLQGKIVNLIITVNNDVGLDAAKALAPKALESFDEDQRNYYDFQIFIKKNSEAKDFPIIGYKQNKKSGFNWTKDRAAS